MIFMRPLKFKFWEKVAKIVEEPISLSVIAFLLYFCLWCPTFFFACGAPLKEKPIKKKNFSICRNIFLKEKLSGKNPSFFFDLRDLVFRPKKFSRLRCLFVIFFRDLFFYQKISRSWCLSHFFSRPFFFWPQIKCCACGA